MHRYFSQLQCFLLQRIQILLESYDKFQEMALEKKIEAAESVDVGGKH
jgi:hypothetical protein